MTWIKHRLSGELTPAFLPLAFDVTTLLREFELRPNLELLANYLSGCTDSWTGASPGPCRLGSAALCLAGSGHPTVASSAATIGSCWGTSSAG